MSAADVARLLTLGALWGGSFAFMRVAVGALGPVWLATSRVVLAFLALYALALARGNVPALRNRWRDYLIAVLACLAGAFCYGTASVYAKARLTGLPSFAIALYSQMTAMIVLVPALPFVPLPVSITPLVAANVVALAVASTAVGYLLYFRLIATIGPARALTVTFLIPLFGVLWGFLFLDEKIGANTLGAWA